MPLFLCLNSGSSSIKYALFRLEGEEEERLREGKTERLGSPEGSDYGKAFSEVLEQIEETPDAIVHRVVHGGEHFCAPVFIDEEVAAGLRAITELAPEHQPGALAGIDAARTRFPHLPQVACFDTAFHQRMPEVAKRLPLPARFVKQGVRRYGFHGLSYEYLVSELGADMPPRTILAHLGNGSSLVALREGTPMDTTMGFTPAGGVMMGSRCGDLDPGVFLYLLRNEGCDADRLNTLLNEESGLRGVSGLSADMRTLLKKAGEGHDSARAAIELYAYLIRREIGSLAAVLGGVDLIVFTGGIGENRAEVREMILQGLDFLHAKVRVMPTNEALIMARAALALIKKA